jgi:hypothetical protein
MYIIYCFRRKGNWKSGGRVGVAVRGRILETAVDFFGVLW